jgi:hypothetical protein
MGDQKSWSVAGPTRTAYVDDISITGNPWQSVFRETAWSISCSHDGNPVCKFWVQDGRFFDMPLILAAEVIDFGMEIDAPPERWVIEVAIKQWENENA